MRISTRSFYDQNVSSLHRQQSSFLEVGQQIASGRRVVKPSDDPQAAARAVGVSQSKAVTEQYADARIGARNALAQEESVLASLGEAVTRAKTLMVQASSDTLSDVDRASIASELRGLFETVLGQANSTDGNGRYLFGGYNDGSAPFVRAGDSSVNYVGDANAREQRIDASRLMPVADNGLTVFAGVPPGAGYVAEADPGNSGTLTFVGPQVVDASDAGYGARFDIAFSVTGDTHSYSINGGPAQVWEPGTPLEMGGLTLALDGLPADGDSLSLDLAGNRGGDLFTTLGKAIATLETPAATGEDKAARRNTLSTVMRELDNSLDNLLTVRASVGARLNELDTVDDVADLRLLNYEQTLSDLIDLDYVEAISDFTRRQVGLQAAQKTFSQITQLSLFDHI